MFPFKRLFKGNIGILPGHLLGILTKEKGPYEGSSPFRGLISRRSKPCTKIVDVLRISYEKAFFNTMVALEKALKGNQ